MKRIAFFIIAFAMSLSINAQDYQKLWQEFNNNIALKGHFSDKWWT